MDRIEKLKEFLQSTPDDSFLRHALALEYIKAGEETQARALFEQVLQKEPGYVGTYYHLAKLLERTNEIEEAVRVYEKGMQEAKKAGDSLSFSELRAAYEELTF